MSQPALGLGSCCIHPLLLRMVQELFIQAAEFGGLWDPQKESAGSIQDVFAVVHGHL